MQHPLNIAWTPPWKNIPPDFDQPFPLLTFCQYTLSRSRSEGFLSKKSGSKKLSPMTNILPFYRYILPSTRMGSINLLKKLKNTPVLHTFRKLNYFWFEWFGRRLSEDQVFFSRKQMGAVCRSGMVFSLLQKNGTAERKSRWMGID